MFTANTSFRRLFFFSFVFLSFWILLGSPLTKSKSEDKKPSPAVAESLESTALLTPPMPPGVTRFDFDGDGKADLSRWKASNGEWKIRKSTDSSMMTQLLGASGNAVVPADYDGDGKTDTAVFSASTGTWTIKKSSNNQTQTISNFGQTGDKSVSGDYDGDGTADAAVYRPSNSTWYVKKSTDGTVVSTQYGASGDIPVPGNYNGDSLMDYAVFRPSTGNWFVKFSGSGGETSAQWGAAADVPVPADFDGDGKTDFSVFRPSTGTWYILKSSSATGEYIAQGWGNYGDQPLPADFDGDGKADFAVWRPTTGYWYIIQSSNQSYDFSFLGAAGDFAVPSAYLKQLGGVLFSYDFARARLAPKNSTGGTDLYSQNFGWGTSLVSLPGRAGLDAGLGISYNSLVWTKDAVNNTIVFNADNSNISPGFRFGFPTIEPAYYDAQTGKFAYLMVTPSGARVEFRQSAASDTYETADSSYTQLKINNAASPNDPAENLSLTVRSTDGTQMLYEWKNGFYRCQKITDRNGNFISINHDANGWLQTVTDTLGRVIQVNYDAEGSPSTITQTWKDTNGAGANVTRTYATFSYTTKAITTNFSGVTVNGPGDGAVVKVLDKITFGTSAANTGAVNFLYNSYGQVWKIENRAANSDLLNSVRTNLETPTANQTDCPRFTETWTKTKDFNGDQEVKITNAIQTGQTYTVPGATGTATLITAQMEGHPHGLVSKTYVGATGWREGLPIVTEDWANGASGLERKRWTWTSWTQDDTNAALIQNPRVIESKVGDTTNIKRSTTDYYPVSAGSPVALYGLVKEVKVYDADQTTILKKAVTEYNLDTAYLSRRIIGLPSKTESYGVNQGNNNVLELVSKVTYAYDEGDFSDATLEQNLPAAIQHDNTNYGSAFTTGRGNLTAARRWNVETPDLQSASVLMQTKYNTAGAPVAQIDALGRTTKIGYADKFNDNVNRSAYAYPTKLTDAGGNFSEVKYRYDIGANVWAKSPAPAGNTTGKTTERLFDSFGRLQQETLANTGAYTRYEYPTNGVQAKVFSTVIDTNNNGADASDEVMSETWTDGAGRSIRSRTEHPGSTGGWSGSLIEYDILGQVKRSTVPTEIAVNAQTNVWTPTGDDAARGWLWKYQKYDWKGRVTRIINTDGIDSETLNDSDQLFSYEGCGCAGGEVVTIESENVPRDDVANTNARRKQKIYADILGRQYKTEIYNWDGASVYTSTVQTFNGRDQIVKTRQYAGTTGSSTFQDVTMTYDGHGRMKTRHYPVEDIGADTSWSYNADDSIQMIIDPRGAITNFTYNDPRGLLTQISYQLPDPNPSNIPATPTVTFAYDNLGNRTQMTDGTGTTAYAYNQLSQILSETKTFSGLSGNFTIGYGYHIGGGLKTITDPFGSSVNYTNDKAGRLTKVAGTAFANNSTGEYLDQIKYRAFGKIKQMDYKTLDNQQAQLSYDNRLRVNDYRVTSSAASGGFLAKSEFDYTADSRLQTKTDMLSGAWNQTLKYDFAGRLTFNQYGRENGATGKRIYEQTIAYDAFSQMTSRQATHWDSDVGFTASYLNGRKQNSMETYDAAGNITHAPGDDLNSFQTTAFDAAGRQTALTERWHTGGASGQTFIVWESKTEHLYDGDGRPAIERFGQLQRQPNEQNPPPVQTSPRAYQLWSTVLGGSLTEIDHTGEQLKTNVYAGGAIIAEQRHLASQQTSDEVVWFHSDTVTGTEITSTRSGFAVKKEIEPLGQKVDTSDPTAAEPPQNYQSFVGSVVEPEWQCQNGFGYDFWRLPEHCQRSIERSFENKLEEFAGLKGSVTKITLIDAKPSQMPSLPNPTDKPRHTQGFARGGKLIINASMPQDEDDIIKIETREPAFPIEQTAQYDGSASALFKAKRKNYQYKDELRGRLDERLNHGECRSKLNALLKELGSNQTIDDISNELFKSKEGLQITEERVSVSASAGARFDYGSGPRQVVFNNLNDYSDKVASFNADSGSLLHEILHIANRSKGTYSHEQIVDAIRRLGETTEAIPDALDLTAFSNIKNKKERNNAIEKAKAARDRKFSGVLGKWIDSYCTFPELGKPKS